MKTFLLIAQSPAGYEPIAEVTESESQEFAKMDMELRRKGARECFCPEEYALWERGESGRYQVHSIIPIK